MSWCGSVGNNKVGVCSSVSVVCRVVWCSVDNFYFGWLGCG